MREQPGAEPTSRTIAEILAEHPEAIETLQVFEIHLDAFTLVALRCTPAELAEFSALRRPGELEAALRRVAGADVQPADGAGSE